MITCENEPVGEQVTTCKGAWAADLSVQEEIAEVAVR